MNSLQGPWPSRSAILTNAHTCAAYYTLTLSPFSVRELESEPQAFLTLLSLEEVVTSRYIIIKDHNKLAQ